MVWFELFVLKKKSPLVHYMSFMADNTHHTVLDDTMYSLYGAKGGLSYWCIKGVPKLGYMYP